MGLPHNCPFRLTKYACSSGSSRRVSSCFFNGSSLGTEIIDYFEREVLPHAPDVWINPDFADEKDRGVGKVGYEINFNRHFYTYQPPRPVAEIDKNIRKVEKNILEMLKEVMG